MTFNFDEFTKSFGFPARQKSSIVRTQVSDRVDLIYLSDLGKAGIHIRGLASMLNCDHSVIRRAIEGGAQEHVVELEVPTAGGLQGGAFILERGVVQVLKTIRRSNCAQATKDAAEELYDRFAEAGFKLYTMLEVAPEALIPEGYHKSPPQPDRFAEMRAQAELAIALAGNPGAIEAYKSLFCAPSVTAPAVQTPPSLDDEEFLDKIIDRLQTPKTSVKAPMEALPMLQDFFTKLDALKRKGVCGEWNSTIIYRARKSWIALHMADIWPKMENYFDMEYTRFQLELAILELGGERRTLQRFIPEEGGDKKTKPRHCALVPGNLDV